MRLRILAGGLLAALSYAAVAASPDAFTFDNREDMRTDAFVSSQIRSVSGFAGTLDITVSGAPGSQYRIDDGPYTNDAGVITAGQTLQLRHITSASTETASTTTLQVGDYSTSFTTVTTNADRQPNPFDLGSRDFVAPQTLVESDIIVPAGYDTATRVRTGSGSEYRINEGEWQTTAGLIEPGQSLQTRHLSHANDLGYVRTYVDVGGVRGWFISRTNGPIVSSDPPVDTDLDGVADGDDLCPDTPSGYGVDADGCSVRHCREVASSSVLQCFSEAVASKRSCYLGGGELSCHRDNSALQASRDTLSSEVLAACANDATVRGAGFGDLLTPPALVTLLDDACIGNVDSLAARSLGGPHAKLLSNNELNPAATQCLTTIYDEGAALIEGEYSDYANCVLDEACGLDLAANQAAREGTAAQNMEAICSQPSMEDLQGSSPAIFAARTTHQARCMVAEGHGDTRNVALDCGPDNVLFNDISVHLNKYYVNESAGNNVSARDEVTENLLDDPSITLDNLPRGKDNELVVRLKRNDGNAWPSRCGNGDDYGFVVRLADDDDALDDMLFHQEGGGVCLADRPDCIGRPAHYFLALDNNYRDIRKGYHTVRPENPLRNWTHVFQPYCNQDLHIGGGGDEPSNREDIPGGTLYRYGAINYRASTRFMRDLVWRMRRHGSETGYRSNQPRVIVSGTSAGGYGVQYNLHYPLDEMRWENTLGSPHAAFVIGGGTTDITLLFDTFGETWATRPFQTPYCLQTGCSLTKINHPAHAERLGGAPMQLILQTSAQHDNTQESTQGYPGPASGGGQEPPGKQAHDWLNLLRQEYCEIKDTPYLFFHLGANTDPRHDFLNTDSFYDPELLDTRELLVNGEGMTHWLADIADNPAGAHDRVEDGITIDRVREFPCTPDAGDPVADQDADGIADYDDICRGTVSGTNVALNGCPILPTDTDADGVADDADLCAATPVDERASQYGCSASQVDYDEDGFGDPADNCDTVPNVDQSDQDADGLGDACDADIDADGVANADDNCPNVANGDQLDTNFNGTGDACENPASARPTAFPDCYQPDLTVAPDQSLHACSWNNFAHGLQRQLGADTPMHDALWLASHNSYNYPAAENPSSIAPNQQVDLVQQLDLGMRAVEIDIHWAESPRCSGNLQPLVCHSQGDHSTCEGTEPTSDVYFNIINDWLTDNPGEVLQVDIESNFGVSQHPTCPPGSPAPAGGNPYTVVGQQFHDIFDTRLYTTGESGSATLPMGLSLNGLPAGEQVIVTGNFNVDATWSSAVHSLGGVRVQHVFGNSPGAQNGNTTYPGCDYSSPTDGSHITPAVLTDPTKWTRMWEDRTGLTAQAQPMLDSNIVEMLKCGLNMPSFDRITSSDTRLAAMVWSWAEGEPVPNDEANCALHPADGRLVSAACGASLRFACASADRKTWSVPVSIGPPAAGPTVCGNVGMDFAVPGTSEFNELLKSAKSSAGVTEVWVNYSEDAVTEGIWIPGP